MSSAARPVVMIGIALGVGLAAYFMIEEQNARSASQAAFQKVNALMDDGESHTPDQVHEHLGRQPDTTRTPGPHQWVEEYRWASNIGQHILYAYYRTGATKLLEAVSLNQQLAGWEQESEPK